jgi:hypothetical protein
MQWYQFEKFGRYVFQTRGLNRPANLKSNLGISGDFVHIIIRGYGQNALNIALTQAIPNLEINIHIYTVLSRILLN